MTQQLLCPFCGFNYQLSKEEITCGIAIRIRYIPHVMRPANHGYEMQGHFQSCLSITCDNSKHCGRAIHIGTPAYAITKWRTEGYRPESEPDLWEARFGTITDKLPTNEPD